VNGTIKTTQYDIVNIHHHQICSIASLWKWLLRAYDNKWIW